MLAPISVLACYQAKPPMYTNNDMGAFNLTLHIVLTTHNSVRYSGKHEKERDTHT